MPVAIALFAEFELALTVTPVRNDCLAAAILQQGAQLAFVGFVTKQRLSGFDLQDQFGTCGTVVRLSAGQHSRQKTAFSIADCVHFRVSSPARPTNRLILLLPFPPEAEQCAFTWVESIVCVWAERPRAVSAWNKFSQTPRRAQRTKRL
jgi:hypothetical protein